VRDARRARIRIKRIQVTPVGRATRKRAYRDWEALLGWLVVGGCDKADSEYNGKENQTTRHRRSDNSI